MHFNVTVHRNASEAAHLPRDGDYRFVEVPVGEGDAWTSPTPRGPARGAHPPLLPGVEYHVRVAAGNRLGYGQRRLTRPPVVRVPRQAPGLPGALAPGGFVEAPNAYRVAHGHPRGGRRAGLDGGAPAGQLRGAVGHAAGLRRRPRRAAGPRGVAAADGAARLRPARRGRRRLHVHGKNDDGRASRRAPSSRHLPGRRHRVPSRCGRATSTPRRSTARSSQTSSSRAMPRGGPAAGRQRQPPVRGRAARRRCALPHRGLTEGQHLTCAWPARTPPRAWAVRRHAPVVAAVRAPAAAPGAVTATPAPAHSVRVAWQPATVPAQLSGYVVERDEAGRAERAGLALRPRRGPEGHDLHERDVPNRWTNATGGTFTRVRRRDEPLPGTVAATQGRQHRTSVDRRRTGRRDAIKAAPRRTRATLTSREPRLQQHAPTDQVYTGATAIGATLYHRDTTIPLAWDASAADVEGALDAPRARRRAPRAFDDDAWPTRPTPTPPTASMGGGDGPGAERRPRQRLRLGRHALTDVGDRRCRGQRRAAPELGDGRQPGTSAPTCRWSSSTRASSTTRTPRRATRPRSRCLADDRRRARLSA